MSVEQQTTTITTRHHHQATTTIAMITSPPPAEVLPPALQTTHSDDVIDVTVAITIAIISATTNGQMWRRTSVIGDEN